MNTYIVLINVDSGISNPRGACEGLEGIVFNDINDNLTSLKIRNKVLFELGLTEQDSQEVEVEHITSFMDRVNDELFNPNNYFLSYVYARTKDTIK